MRIKSVEIKGFRNIKSIKVILDKMTVLVSENSYGKSNVMTAIDFAVDFIHGNSYEKTAMMEYAGGIPLNVSNDSENFSCEFEFEDFFLDKSVTYLYGYEFIWNKDEGFGTRIIKEWLSYKENAINQKYTKLIQRDDKAFYKSSPTGRCSSVIDVSENELVINKLHSNSNLFYSQILDSINSFGVYVERHLDASGYFNIDPLIRKDASKTVDINEVDNIPRTVFNLKMKYKDKYDLLIDSFKQLFPYITEIDVKEIDFSKSHAIEITRDAPYTISDKVYSLYFKNENINQPLGFKWLSDGAKRIFLMLTYAIVADINNLALIAFEEPENSIHPALLQNYLDTLYQLSENCKIMCASHSPYILQYVDTKNVYIGKPNKLGLANFSKIDSRKVSELLKDSTKNSSSVGDYIFELLSGGEDDIKILLDYLEN